MGQVGHRYMAEVVVGTAPVAAPQALAARVSWVAVVVAAGPIHQPALLLVHRCMEVQAVQVQRELLLALLVQRQVAVAADPKAATPALAQLVSALSLPSKGQAMSAQCYALVERKPGVPNEGIVTNVAMWDQANEPNWKPGAPVIAVYNIQGTSVGIGWT